MITDTKPLAERLNLARAIEQYRNGSPGFIASGSPAQVINALKDAKHDVLALADALDAQAVLLTEAATGLRDLMRDYVSLMETARDRIISCGGSCDPVNVMEQASPTLQSARSLLSRIEAVK